jgi:GAF domain-containing protein
MPTDEDEHGVNSDPKASRPPDGSPAYALKKMESLAREIAEGRAIVYVGAGVSQSAGFDSWEKLLGQLLERASGRLETEGVLTTKYFSILRSKSRNLEVADWLDILLHPDFSSEVASVLLGSKQERRKPSAIHRNLARLPFSMAITTNYDLLLTTAYEEADPEGPKPNQYTWKQVRDILAAIRKRTFAIIHSHGHIDDLSSIILAGNQYSAAQYRNPRFWEVMKWLFKTKTFLFVGAGLEDPDLIYQLQEARAESKEAAVLHYALLPHDEAPRLRREILKRSLSIEVIPVGTEDQVLTHDEKAWLSPAVSRILRDLSGLVAAQRVDAIQPGLPTSDDPTFCLNASLKKLLGQAVRLTGSFRGDFCLSPDGPASHLSGKLVYALVEGPTDPKIKNAHVTPNSICGIAYYQATSESGVYVIDVKRREIARQSKLGHYGVVEYVPGDPAVMSELAIPIDIGAVRVGVLNLESNLVDAYSEDHLKVARRFAEKAGRLYAAAYERKQRSTLLSREYIEPAYVEIKSVCGRIWKLSRPNQTNSPEFAILVYQADYIEGRLVAQCPIGTILPKKAAVVVERPSFSFHDPGKKNSSLVTRVFIDGRPYGYSNIDRAIQQGKVTDQYVSQLGLQGPVIGFPVLIRGHIAGVVVVGHRGKKRADIDGRDIVLSEPNANAIRQ